MSKRLKLVTGSESEMEERSFLNPFPDWDQGVLSPSPSGVHDSTADLFDPNGKVIFLNIYFLQPHIGHVLG